MEKYDFVIVGAGIVGLTVARAIAAKKLGTICVLEKETALGMHSSGRNSGVLHSGLYYSPDSIKSKVCGAGAKRLMAYCQEKGVPCSKSGKVIIAADQTEIPGLKELYERGLANGVTLELIDEKRLSQIEPVAKTCQVAIYSPNTAVMDPKAWRLWLRVPGIKA